MHLFSILILLLMTSVHDIHVSVTDITASQSENQIELTTRIFLDDLQLAMGRSEDDTDIEDTEFKSKLKIYLFNHIGLIADEKELSFDISHLHFEDLALICSMTFSDINTSEIKSLKVQNTVLQEIHYDQMNMINCHIGSRTRSKALMSGQGSALFKIKRN